MGFRLQAPSMCKNGVLHIPGILALVPMTSLRRDYSKNWKNRFYFVFGN